MNERIVIDPKICHGKPVIRGTRTPVAIVVGSLAGGVSFEEVQREYDLTAEDIRAALAFAAEAVEEKCQRLARPPRPAPGLGKGSILSIAPDFEETPEEFMEYVE